MLLKFDLLALVKKSKSDLHLLSYPVVYFIAEFGCY